MKTGMNLICNMTAWRKPVVVAAIVVAMVAWSGRAAESVVSAPAPDLAELSIEQLVQIEVESVYGASKYEQKVTQAPSSVSIITADEIRKSGHRTLADVLRSVRGLYVSDDRNYSYLGIRGFLRPGDYNTRVLILINGHRMNDNIFDEPFIAREGTVDVNLIDRIEVIRGPSSSIYGSSAFFGVINIVTKRGGQLNGAEATVEAGSFDSYKGQFSFGRRSRNGLEWLVSGSYYTSEGKDHLYFPEFDQRISADERATNNGVADGLDDETALSLFSSASYREFTLSGFLSHRHKQIPTASYGTMFNDPEEETTDYRAYVDLKYDHAFSEDTRLTGRLFYDNYQYYGSYPFNYALPGDPMDRVVNKDGVVGDWVGTEWQLTERLYDRHTLVIGGEYREDIREYQFAYDDVLPRTYTLKDDRNGRTLGLFAQAEVAILTNLLFNAGLRFDTYFESFGSTLNPRMGLIYNPWRGSAFKILYGSAFRAPNPYERFYFDNQPDLQPEKIQTYELVFEQYFARDYRLNISAYHYDVEDMITQITTPADELLFENVDEVCAKGIEFELEAKYSCGLMARASYTLQHAEDGLNQELTSSPRHLGKLNIIAPLYKDKVFGGLELQCQSSTRTLAGERADGFVIANFTLFSREIVKGLDVSVSVYNLLDAEYGYPGAGDHLQDVLRQDGRSFRVKLTYHF